MKKLTISLVISTVLVLGSQTTFAECGQQHAEKCLTSETSSGKENTEVKIPDILRITIALFSRTMLPF